VSGPGVLVTGAGGYLGSQVVAALAARTRPIGRIIAADVREVPPERRAAAVEYVQADVRSPALVELFSGAIAAVGLALGDHLLAELVVGTHSLCLEVGRVRAADFRPFVPIDA